MSNRIVALLVAAMSSVLSGCFISDQPKFPLSSATPALGEGGRYEVFERVADGNYRRQEMFTVKHGADGGYEFINEKGEVLPISFHPLTTDLFIGQAKPEKDKSGYGYVVVRITGNEAFVYVPQCDSQDKAKLTAFNVTLKDDYNCLLDRVTDPLGLFATLKLGEPTSKMVRR